MENDKIFCVGNHDYSSNVVANEYDINLEDVYHEWSDGGQVIHRDVIRQRINGTIKMYFPSAGYLEEFLQTLKTNKKTNNTYPVKIKVNNNFNQDLQNKDVFLSFRPIRHRDLKWVDMYDVFEVNIQEP